jgi:hypothetical protein
VDNVDKQIGFFNQNQMTPSETSTNSILNSLTNSGFPQSQSLDHPMIANEVWLTLSLASNQKSPYFDLRGCNLEGNYIYLRIRSGE